MSTSLIRRGRVGALNPWRVMEELENRMWDWTNTPFGFTPVSRLVSEVNTYVPPIDMYETKDSVFVAASLPGIDASKIGVEFHNGYVVITGEQLPAYPAEQNAEVTTHLASIPRIGRFSFQLALPTEVEHERAEATYRDGILRVRFPKPERAKPVSIPVSVQTAEPTEPAPKQIENAEKKGRR